MRMALLPLLHDAVRGIRAGIVHNDKLDSTANAC
jgi:hypothetical protein